MRAAARLFLLWSVGASTLALNGCSPPDSQASSDYFSEFWVPPRRAYSQSSAQLAGFTNTITTGRSFDEETGTLVYATGGESNVPNQEAVLSDSPQAPPFRIQAEHRSEGVNVRVRTFDSEASDPELLSFAESVGESIRLATSEIWPRSVIPVEVDIHVMPADAVFALQRTVEWREGDAYRLAIFLPETEMAAKRFTAVHELYHVLAIRWSIGTNGPEATTRRSMASAYEEMAATLYESCAQLLTDGVLPRPASRHNAVLNGRDLEFPLSVNDLRVLFAALNESEYPEGNMIGRLLAAAPVNAVFGEREVIQLNATEGQELLGRCREFSEDPFRLEEWFRRTVDSG